MRDRRYGINGIVGVRRPGRETGNRDTGRRRKVRDTREDSREAALAAAIARQIEEVERTFSDRWEW